METMGGWREEVAKHVKMKTRSVTLKLILNYAFTFFLVRNNQKTSLLFLSPLFLDSGHLECPCPWTTTRRDAALVRSHSAPSHLPIIATSEDHHGTPLDNAKIYLNLYEKNHAACLSAHTTKYAHKDTNLRPSTKTQSMNPPINDDHDGVILSSHPTKGQFPFTLGRRVGEHWTEFKKIFKKIM